MLIEDLDQKWISFMKLAIWKELMTSQEEMLTKVKVTSSVSLRGWCRHLPQLQTKTESHDCASFTFTSVWDYCTYYFDICFTDFFCHWNAVAAVRDSMQNFKCEIPEHFPCHFFDSQCVRFLLTFTNVLQGQSTVKVNPMLFMQCIGLLEIGQTEEWAEKPSQDSPFSSECRVSPIMKCHVTASGCGCDLTSQDIFTASPLMTSTLDMHENLGPSRKT